MNHSRLLALAEAGFGGSGGTAFGDFATGRDLRESYRKLLRGAGGQTLTPAYSRGGRSAPEAPRTTGVRLLGILLREENK